MTDNYGIDEKFSKFPPRSAAPFAKRLIMTAVVVLRRADRPVTAERVSAVPVIPVTSLKFTVFLFRTVRFAFVCQPGRAGVYNAMAFLRDFRRSPRFVFSTVVYSRRTRPGSIAQFLGNRARPPMFAHRPRVLDTRWIHRRENPFTVVNRERVNASSLSPPGRMIIVVQSFCSKSYLLFKITYSFYT